MSGHVYKRCTCPGERDAAGKKLDCNRAHGSWSFVANLPAEGPHPRRQHTKGGYTTKRDAEQALRAFLATVDQGAVVLPTKITFEQYIGSWLEAVEPSLSATTVSNYRIIVRCYLRPQLGAYRLASLRPDHFIKAYRALLTAGGKGGRPLSATTVRTAHRIVSKALNDAVRDGLMHRNPAAHIPLPKQVRPELQVWDRAQVAAFLESAVSDRLRAAWLLADPLARRAPATVSPPCCEQP